MRLPGRSLRVPEDRRRLKGVFALRASQPPARRVYQPTALRSERVLDTGAMNAPFFANREALAW
jgi:hypothetical protein